VIRLCKKVFKAHLIRQRRAFDSSSGLVFDATKRRCRTLTLRELVSELSFSR
jgi:hypothetical protein